MKRVLAFLAIAAALVAVSCAKEQEDPSVGKATVTFTVDAGQITTRAVSGTHGDATRLRVGVYHKNGTEYNYLSALAQSREVTSWPTTVSLELAKNETYKLVFWADENVDAYTIDWTNGTVVETATTINGNLINRDAYYKLVELTTTGAASGEAITLVRPLAQVNVGTSDLASYKAAAAYTGNVETQVVISGVAPGLNLLTGAATSGETKTLTFSYANNLDATLVSDSKNYNYMALNYILCPADATLTAAVSLRKENVTTETINDFTVSYMPVKQNYRTNIVGKLLTGTVYYTVDVDTNFINDLNKPIGPTFSSLAALNTYLGTLKEGTSDGDNGDVTPEQAILTAMGDLSGISGNPQVILPKIHGDVDIRLVFPYAGTLEVVYAEGATDAQKPANIYFYAQKLDNLTATVPASHFELLSGSVVTNKAIVSTNTTTFVIQNGAKVGTAEIAKGKAQIAGTVATVNVPTGATLDGTNPVYVFLEKVSSVEKIELAAKTDVVVEQPKDQITKDETERKVAVYVKEGADNSTAKAQNGGVIYVKADVPCAVTVDGTSEAEDGSAVSSTVIIDSGAGGSTVTAENGGAINLTADGDCEVMASGSSTPEDPTETPVPSSVVIDKVDTGVEVNTETEGDATVEPAPDAEIDGKISAYVAKNKTTEEKYTSLYDAVAAAESEDTIEMIDNSTEENQISLTKKAIIDLNGYTITFKGYSETLSEKFPNNAAFYVASDSEADLTIYSSKKDDLENTIKGAISLNLLVQRSAGFFGNGTMTMRDIVLTKENTAKQCIYVENGKAILDNLSVTAIGGAGGIYLADNVIGKITNCVINQSGNGSSPWLSSALAISDGAKIEVAGCALTGVVPFFIFNSGGEATLKNSSFTWISGGSYGQKDIYLEYGTSTHDAIVYIYNDCKLSLGYDAIATPVGYSPYSSNAYVWFVNAIDDALIVNKATELQYALAHEWPLLQLGEGATGNFVNGGVFNNDPSAHLAEGYFATYDSTTQHWTVAEDAVAQIGTKTYGTLAKAFAAVKANEEIVVLKNCEVKDHIDVDKSPVTLNLNGFTVKNSVTNARMLDVTASNGQLTINGNGKIYIDANENVTSYGFVRLQAYGSKFILDNAELEGVTENAALLRFNNGGQSMEIKNNSRLTLTAGPNVTNKGRGTIIYNNGTNNTLSITDTDIYNCCEATQWSAMISMENRSCTFENVRYYSETGPTGFFTGAATYTNCSIELQRTGTLNIDWNYPWLMSAVSTSGAKSVTINSGTYKGYYGIFVYTSGGDITVKDGTFEGTAAVINSENNTWEPGYAGASSINIEGGDFTGKIMAAAWGGAGTSPVAAINISGGKFKVDSSDALFTPNNASILVSGGVFSQDPTPYLKSGYKVIENPDANADDYPYKVVVAE